MKKPKITAEQSNFSFSEIILRLVKQLAVLTNFDKYDWDRIKKFSLPPHSGQVILKKLEGADFYDFRRSFSAPLAVQCMPFGYRDFILTRISTLFKSSFEKIEKYFHAHEIEEVVALNTEWHDLNHQLRTLKKEPPQKLVSKKNILLAKKIKLTNIAENIKLININKPRSLKELATFSLYKHRFFETNPDSKGKLPNELKEYLDVFYDQIELPELPKFYAIYLLGCLLAFHDINGRAEIGYPFIYTQAVFYGFLDRYDCQVFLEDELLETELKEKPGIVSLLHIACICNDELLLRFLLEKKLPQEKFFWLYPLHWAAQLGYANTVTLLLEYGADVNARGFNGLTALHLAVRFGHEQIAQILIGKGARSDVTDAQKRSVLYMACVGGNLSLVQFLANIPGMDMVAATEDGSTSVHAAAFNGHLEILKYLIQEKQLDPQSLDKKGKTPFDLAIKYILDAIQGFKNILVRSNFAVVKWFVEKEYIKLNQNNYREILEVSLHHYDVDFVLMLLKDETIFSEAVLTCPFGLTNETILHYAIRYDCAAIIPYLIATRKTFVQKIINLQNGKHGNTVLHLTALVGNTEFYQILITAGADASIQNSDNQTPAQILAEEESMQAAYNSDAEDAQVLVPMQLG